MGASMEHKRKNRENIEVNKVHPLADSWKTGKTIVFKREHVPFDYEAQLSKVVK